MVASPYTHPLVSGAPGPGRASGRPPGLLHALSSPRGSQLSLGLYASTNSLGRSTMLPQRPLVQLLYCPAPTRLGSDHPAPVLHRAYTTRIRPSSSCTVPRLHDSDQTGSAQPSPGGPAPPYMGHSGTQPRYHLSERPSPGPWSAGSPGVRSTSSAEILACTSSGHWQAPHLPGIDKPLASRASTSASPTPSRRAKYPQLRPAPCWIIWHARRQGDSALSLYTAADPDHTSSRSCHSPVYLGNSNITIFQIMENQQLFINQFNS